MLAHCVIDDWTEHLLDLVRVKRAGRSCASDKQKVRISPEVYVAPVETVESGDHDHKPLAHPTFEQFASDIVPLVQPVIDPPHLLQLSIGIFHLDGPRKFSQRFCLIIRKQENGLGRFSESAEEFVDVLEQSWKVSRCPQCLHVPLT